MLALVFFLLAAVARALVCHQAPLSASRRSPRTTRSLTTTTMMSKKNAVKTVSETMRAFESAYTRPIVTVWRGPISDMLQVTHLSVVDKRFKYDAIFGYGYMYIFNTLLDKYPVDGEKDQLIDATIAALDLKPSTLRKDEADVKAWLASKTAEAQILDAPSTPNESRVNQALADVKANDDYLHTRCGNVAVLTMIDHLGLKADNATLTRWTDALGMRKRNVEKDAVLLKDVREKMGTAMQMIKSLEIREKKRMADQLEKKAKEAQLKAEEQRQTKDNATKLEGEADAVADAASAS
mmetsp:Transcript_1288/g.4368  ORF Transcript_1288/g.4368 Transcript_1288/m.4368 type:complete len:295 (+) Transcript_1288:42-926(+)